VLTGESVHERRPGEPIDRRGIDTERTLEPTLKPTLELEVVAT